MAGRKKAGVTPGLAEELSKFLRRLRPRPGGSEITYSEMAEILGGRRYCSAVTLSRADQGGDRVPRVETVTGYVVACEGTPDDLRHARRLLSTAQRSRQRALTAEEFDDPKQGARVARQRHRAVSPHPDYMRSRLDFQQGLKGYREESGGLSMRAIAENAQAADLHITKSTVHRMLSPEGMFLSWESVEAFLTGCRPARLPDMDAWRRAWQRVFGQECQDEFRIRDIQPMHSLPPRADIRTNVVSHHPIAPTAEWRRPSVLLRDGSQDPKRGRKGSGPSDLVVAGVISGVLGATVGVLTSLAKG
ncbi:hypothetical protein [Kitasatospora sp. NPDC002965]|uniref:hypothetical protein n=1 Tax=unclassified Kitasatospora TaxID=2633591 RepID=UPI0033A9B0CE